MPCESCRNSSTSWLSEASSRSPARTASTSQMPIIETTVENAISTTNAARIRVRAPPKMRRRAIVPERYGPALRNLSRGRPRRLPADPLHGLQAPARAAARRAVRHAPARAGDRRLLRQRRRRVHAEGRRPRGAGQRSPRVHRDARRGAGGQRARAARRRGDLRAQPRRARFHPAHVPRAVLPGLRPRVPRRRVVAPRRPHRCAAGARDQRAVPRRGVEAAARRVHGHDAALRRRPAPAPHTARGSCSARRWSAATPP